MITSDALRSLLPEVSAAGECPLSESFQFFGEVRLEDHSRNMIVSLNDLEGATVFSKRLDPRPVSRFYDD